MRTPQGKHRARQAPWVSEPAMVLVQHSQILALPEIFMRISWPHVGLHPLVEGQSCLILSLLALTITSATVVLLHLSGMFSKQLYMS